MAVCKLFTVTNRFAALLDGVPLQTCSNTSRQQDAVAQGSASLSFYLIFADLGYCLERCPSMLRILNENIQSQAVLSPAVALLHIGKLFTRK